MRFIMKKSIFVFVLIFAVSILFITAQEKKSFGSKNTTQQKTSQQNTTQPQKKSFGTTTKTQETKTTSSKKKKTTAKMFKGYLVSLNGVMQGDYNLSKNEALQLAKAGAPIVLIDSKSKSGKIYFLVGQGGESINQKVAHYAVYKKVAVSGWYKYVNRTRFIIVDFIENGE